MLIKRNEKRKKKNFYFCLTQKLHFPSLNPIFFLKQHEVVSKGGCGSSNNFVEQTNRTVKNCINKVCPPVTLSLTTACRWFIQEPSSTFVGDFSHFLYFSFHFIFYSFHMPPAVNLKFQIELYTGKKKL